MPRPVDFLDAIKGWRRSLKRAQELRVATPDPTLLMGALDAMGAVVTRTSPQAAFRLNSTGAQLMVDVNPTLGRVTNYADSILAEAEGLNQGGVPVPTTAKIKAMDGGSVEAPTKGDGKGKGQERSGKEQACKFFGTDDGCKKGVGCTYNHDWALLHERAHLAAGTVAPGSTHGGIARSRL